MRARSLRRGPESKKGSEQKCFGPFSCQLACRHRPFGVLERGDTGPGDLQGHAASRIARAGKSQTFAQRYRLAIELQMGACIVLEKSDDELRAIGAAIILKGLGERGRRGDRAPKKYRAENGDPAIIHILPLAARV